MKSEETSKFSYHVDAEPLSDGGSQRIWHVLAGPKGAVQFMVLKLPEHLAGTGLGDTFPYMGADVGYHAREPQYEGQEVMESNCRHIGGPCYYDGSSLRAMEWAHSVYSLPVEKRDEFLRLVLREEYREVFGG